MMDSVVSPDTTAEAVLSAILPEPLSGETIEGRFLSPLSGRPPVRRFYRSTGELLEDAKRFAPAHHCYYGVALRQGQNGKAEAASRTGANWADIDAKLWPAAPDPKRCALEAVEAFAPRPSIVIDSGGGFQPYWLFNKPFALCTPDAQVELELVNAGLARAVCGPDRAPDHAHDVARVLRIPGTFNHKREYGWPRPVAAVVYEPDRRYRLDELRRLLQERYPWALHRVASLKTARQGDWSPSAESTVDLRQKAERGQIRPETLALLDSTGPAGRGSPSEADAVIAVGLMGAGLTKGEAFSLLTASTRGKDAVHRKGERYAEAYWRRTVASAAEWVGPVVEREDGTRVRRLPSTRRPIGVPLRVPTLGAAP
jgi:hypothetical protein